MKFTKPLMLGALLLGAATSHAVLIEVTFTAGNNSTFAPAFGQFTTDNSNPIVTGGAMASPGLELLAELGNGGTLATERGGGNANLFSGPIPAGASRSFTFDVDASTPYFNFASMLLPSNDWFIGTGGLVPTINVSSLLNGTATALPDIVFNNLYDAGTEEEDFNFAAPPGAFLGIMNNPPGGTPTMDGISLVDLDNGNPFLNFANIPSGADLSAFDPTGGPIGTLSLTVVPEPSSSLLAGLALVAGLARRRRA